MLRRDSLVWPLVLLLFGVALIIARLHTPVGAALGQQTGYPARTPTAAINLTSTVPAYPGPNVQPVQTATPPPSPTAQRSPAAAVVATTVTPDTPRTAASTPQPVPPQQAAATLPPAVTPTPSPTTSPFSSVVLTCPQGRAVLVTGQAPPLAPLLMYFNQRAVGGTVAAATGVYRVPLVVGPEQPGSYPVQIRVRGTSWLVNEFTCVVP